MLAAAKSDTKMNEKRVRFNDQVSEQEVPRWSKKLTRKRKRVQDDSETVRERKKRRTCKTCRKRKKSKGYRMKFLKEFCGTSLTIKLEDLKTIFDSVRETTSEVIINKESGEITIKPSQN